MEEDGGREREKEATLAAGGDAVTGLPVWGVYKWASLMLLSISIYDLLDKLTS